MRFGSVCSGIEAASVAWNLLGWKAAWLSEIEPFPCAVLSHHYPDVPNLGDMTALPNRILSGDVEAPDLFCGGTPCQAFSVAGNRQSLDDHRGNLTLTFCEIADAIDTSRAVRKEQATIIFWENVPGVLSTKDNAFGCFLAKLAGEDGELQPSGKKWSNAGVVYGPKRTVAWRVLDAQYFGVAQRRRRVFVVASARDGFDPAAVLFESEGLRRDIAPGRKAGKEVTELAGTLAANGGGLNRPAGNANELDFCIAWPAEIAPTLNASFGDKQGLENQHIRGGQDYLSLAKTLITKTRLASETETFIPVGGYFDNVSYGLAENTIGRQPQNGGNGTGFCEELQYTLNATGVHGVACLNPDQPQVWRVYDSNGIAPTTQAGESRGNAIFEKMAVRRLTPVECERLQGFPDGYTDIKSNSKLTPDGPRYKALGNSWAVPVVRWIGERIQKELNK